METFVMARAFRQLVILVAAWLWLAAPALAAELAESPNELTEAERR